MLRLDGWMDNNYRNPARFSSQVRAQDVWVVLIEITYYTSYVSFDNAP